LKTKKSAGRLAKQRITQVIAARSEEDAILTSFISGFFLARNL